METLTFITGNSRKASELGRHLDHPVTHRTLNIPEIQSLEVEAVAADKAERAYAMVNTPVLVEDTALTFNALGALPGPLIKWFLTALENEGLTHLLDGYEDRTAIAEVCYAYCNGATTKTFRSFMNGSIAEHPRGEHGFGWDPIFVPEGYALTWGEMDEEMQRETSMRAVALQKLAFFLTQ